MPVERDLELAKKALYDDKEYLEALALCDKILKESKENVMALIYKSTTLEKLYFSTADWHNPSTLESTDDLLQKALKIVSERGDRTKIGLVHFRFFIHYFNLKDYLKAKKSIELCKEYGFVDNTLPMWEINLQKKLKKLSNIPQNELDETMIKSSDETASQIISPDVQPIKPSGSEEIKYRTDWYQTNKNVNLSIFTKTLPAAKTDINIQYDQSNQNFHISYPIKDSSTSFNFEIILAYPVEKDKISYDITSRKIEITLTKVDQSINWRTLESISNQQTFTTCNATDRTKASDESSLKYPNSSKSKIDWSKIDLGSDDEDDGIDKSSADAFFQKLYADASPDTQRAMMKSFVESNGTALNTNWDDVKNSKVETSPPEGMELKEF